MKILLTIPSVFEAAPVFKQAKTKPELGKIAKISDDISAIVAGIGCETSQKRLRNAIENLSPDCIILLGYCGACSDTISNGDFVFSCDDENFSKLLLKQGMKQVSFACVEKTADSAQKQSLAERGFDAVEMESDFFKSVAENANVKFVHIRCVSDAKKSPLPADLLDATMDRQTGAINPMKMLELKKLIAKPSILINLARFGIEIAPIQKFFSSECKKLVETLKIFATEN